MDADILISGGGIAGLVAAAALGNQGCRVCLVDPALPREAEDPEADLRTTAFLRPARRLFDQAGLWSALEPHATPLDALRVIDSSGWPPVERSRREFRPDDIGAETFGWNLPNWLTRRELVRVAGQMPGVDLRLGVGFQRMLVRDREVLVTLTEGQPLRVRLVIGADGRNSPVREAAEIPSHTTRYGQKALAFTVIHPEPHGNVSTEIYNRGGAFTLVPVRDHQERPASAVVWMEDGPRASRLATMPPEEFEAELAQRSLGILGPLTLVGPRRVWPVVTSRAERLTAPRVALMAEAAHVLPPIGAQGLNTSLHDVSALTAAVEGADDPGAEAPLAAYVRAREADVRARATAIDLFNRICRSNEAPVQALRQAGLAAVHGLAPLRRGVMRAGLGDGGF
ncbi:FAD-dependent monooxygenase [Roseitranquillus sediminis]|uniref:FAD-dependent monooxygenase n=1 Tax=Roseitranquillus sediminis TaxID=2809051 RepID=UPI001D0C99AB|nr:FAD-dependent monooxygenase [Roseitranquillus sediminis]MBM9594737.1 FAD-dependent monooxygenase [Roseitranquillus sediminis]